MAPINMRQPLFVALAALQRSQVPTSFHYIFAGPLMDFSLDFTPTYRGPHGNYRKWCLIFIVVVQYTVPFLIRDVFVVGTQILRKFVFKQNIFQQTFVILTYS